MQKSVSSFSSWSELLSGAPRAAHIVQLYDRDAFLVRAVAHFAAEGLEKGERVVLAGTRAHLEDISAALRLRGIDTAGATHAGWLVAGDIDEAVESAWRGGGLSEGRLREAVESTLRPLVAGGRAVRWWAESTDALRRRGRAEDAVRWDRIGYDAVSRHAVRVLCSVACDRFAPGPYSGELQDMCRAHTHVIPAEDYVKHRLAVNRAIAEVVGEIRGSLLQSLTSWSGFACELPSSQAMLFWVRETLPERFDAVLAAARAHDRRLAIQAMP